MRKALLAAGAALLLAAGPAAAQQKSVKIGFVSTFSGPTAVDRQRHAQLVRARARPHGPQDGRPAGRGDLRRRRAQAGSRQAEDREADRIRQVDFIAGYIWSNVLLASLKPVVDCEDLPDHRQCRPARRSPANCARPTSSRPRGRTTRRRRPWADYMNQKGVKSRLPDRPELRRRQGHAGRRRRRPSRARCVGEELTTWPAQLDFSAELAKAKAANPDAIFVFYPGKAGVQFLQQYAQAGLKGKIPLYTAFTIDELSLPLQKDLALGVPGAQQWVERPAERRQQEVRRRLHQEVSRQRAVVLRRAEL